MLICDKCKSVIVHTETPYEINYRPVIFPFKEITTRHIGRIVCPKCFKEFENKFLAWVDGVEKENNNE